MLEKFFLKPETVDGIRGSWLGEPIERYVEWLDQNGYAARNMYRRVPVLRQFGEFARSKGAKNWDELPDFIDVFINKRVYRFGSNTRKSSRRLADEIRTPINHFLRFTLPDFKGRGRYSKLKTPFLEQAPAFLDYLREEKGLRGNTINLYEHNLRRLEKYLKKIRLHRFSDITPAILSGFMISSAQELCKTSMKALCSNIRCFLQYLEREGKVKPNLSKAIESPRTYRLSEIPRSITWENVKIMLEGVDRRTALGKRDYAILLLLVTYGLRSSEVAILKLNHIEWERKRILIPERKAGHRTAYPLSSVVGEAIIDYLKKGRPQTKDRHVFFRDKAPRTPISYSIVSNRARYYLRKAGVQVRKPGSHTLRYTCVQRLVDAEFSFKAIGDYVGHSSPSTTKNYSKIDVERLREISLGQEEDLL